MHRSVCRYRARDLMLLLDTARVPRCTWRTFQDNSGSMHVLLCIASQILIKHVASNLEYGAEALRPRHPHLGTMKSPFERITDLTKLSPP